MLKLKNLASIVLALALLLSLVACGNGATEPETTTTTTAAADDPTDAPDDDGDDETTTEPEDEDEPLEGRVVISTQAGPGASAAWQAVADAYMAINEGVDVIVDLKPVEGYDTWIINMFGTDDPEADIVNINLAGPAATGKSINFMEYATLTSPYSGQPWIEQFNFEMQGKDLARNEWTNLSLESVQVLWTYNRDLFEQVNVTPPETWNELIEVCEILMEAGIQPIAAPGDFQSFWAMQMGWLAQIYMDQTTRSMLDVYRAHEGDYNYDPDVDGVFELDINDPFNDDAWNVNQNVVRAYKAIADGVYDPASEGMKTVWSNFAEVFPKYAGGEAFFGTTDALPLFYQGRAAMYIDGAWRIPMFHRDMESLAAGEDIETAGEEVIEGVQEFELGTFNMPSMEGPGIEAPVRTIEVAVGFLGAPSKDREHDALVVDFLMFYSSPEGYSAYMEAGLANGWTPAGPPLVYDVELPDEYGQMFDNLSFIGNAQKGFGQMVARGAPGDVQESLREWYGYSQSFLSEEINIDEWAQKHEENVMKHLPEAMDNSGVLESDLENPQNAPSGR